jgi:hypothetical protein
VQHPRIPNIALIFVQSGFGKLLDIVRPRQPSRERAREGLIEIWNKK